MGAAQEHVDGPLPDAKEALVSRVLVLRHEIEHLLLTRPYDTNLITLEGQLIRLQDTVMLGEASRVDADLDEVDQQLVAYRNVAG